MEVLTDVRFDDMLWSGGLTNYNDYFRDLFTDEELEDVFSEIFFEKPPTDTQINDLFWFEPEFIAEMLGYKLTTDGKMMEIKEGA